MSVAVAIVVGAACHPKGPAIDPIAAAIAAIDAAASKIAAAPDSADSVLQDASKQLTEPAQAAVKLQIQKLRGNAQSATKLGGKCTGDAVGARVVAELDVAKAKLQAGQPVAAPVPFACSSAPSQVEFAAWQQGRVPTVTLTGVELNTPLTVQLVQATGTAPVPDVLAATGPFRATINLGGLGVHLTPQSQKLVVANLATPPIELIAVTIAQAGP